MTPNVPPRVLILMEPYPYHQRPPDGSLPSSGRGTILPGLVGADYIRRLMGDETFTLARRLGVLREYTTMGAVL